MKNICLKKGGNCLFDIPTFKKYQWECLVSTISFDSFLFENKVQNGAYPFSFQSLLENQRLHEISGFSLSFWKDKFRKPCIMLLQTPNLRFGPVLDLINQYDHPSHTMILTDPRYPRNLALSAFPDLKMKIEYCPIDLRLKVPPKYVVFLTTLYDFE